MGWNPANPFEEMYGTDTWDSSKGLGGGGGTGGGGGGGGMYGTDTWNGWGPSVAATAPDLSKWLGGLPDVSGVIPPNAMNPPSQRMFDPMQAQGGMDRFQGGPGQGYGGGQGYGWGGGGRGGQDQMYGVDSWDANQGRRRRTLDPIWDPNNVGGGRGPGEQMYGVDTWDPYGGRGGYDRGGDSGRRIVDTLRGGGFGGLFGRQGPYGWR